MAVTNFRTSSLFHYTSFDSLKKILRGGIIPNFCAEDFSYGNKEYVVGIPMVSFCDIPLMRADVFTERYGQYAIGLSKEWGINNEINPILYISNNDIIDSLKFYKNYEQHLRGQLNNLDGTGGLHVDLSDEDSVNSIANFINHSNSVHANLNFFGYAKKYNGETSKGKNNAIMRRTNGDISSKRVKKKVWSGSGPKKNTAHGEVIERNQSQHLL